MLGTGLVHIINPILRLGVYPDQSRVPTRPCARESGIVSCRDAAELLKLGIRRGMVSEQQRGDWPQNVWAVDADGIVYEAQLSNRERGEYHGYPMKHGDKFAEFVQNEWERRGQ